ncbi:MAG: hypothetical protein HQK87_10600 [Nitrospinae bacterium]|nr:hypothetical protein [Nitrospinota bacterium]
MKRSNGNLSNIGTTPSYSADHPSYQVGNHKNFTCETCHSLPLTGRTAEGEQASVAATTERTRICATCHQGQYNATSILNHQQHGIGTYCNSCHYSDSFRTKNRVSPSKWHSYVSGSCETCHSGRQPASHKSSGRNSGCASCHSYPSWANATGFSHSGVTSGCNNSGCHSKHYAGYDCVWCHTGANPGVSFGGWSHNRTDNRACIACHADGKGDDDDGKGDDDRAAALLNWLN